LIPADPVALRDFWHLYEAHYDQIQDELTKRLAEHPEFGPLLRSMTPEQMAEQNRASRELTRHAVVDNDWQPYLADLQTQGEHYAQAGLSFEAWFEAVAAFRTVLGPLLFAAFGERPEAFLATLEAMGKFLDVAMANLGQGYLGAKELII